MKTLLFILLTLQQLHALVSIAPVEIAKDAGLSGNLEAGLETKRGNTHKDNYKTSMKITYDNNSSFVSWAEFSGEYGKANDIEDTKKLYSHLRFIHTLTDDVIRWELFYQIQKDKYKAINNRSVSGAGLRFNIFDSLAGGRGYLGLGGFYEYIRYIDPNLNSNEDNLRMNTYFAYSLKFNEQSTLAYTLYYQPNIEKFDDYVISNMFELKLNIFKELFLKFSITYAVDSVAPNGIESDYDFTQNTSFIYNF